jgi:hypothetical protein
MRSVYRMYDPDGALLYVGCTSNVGHRLNQHRWHQDWWEQVATVSLEHFADPRTAFAAEWQAINDEHPRFNNATSDSMRRAYAERVERKRLLDHTEDVA